MKLSCLPVSLYQDLSAGRRSLANWFALAADLGLDGADISVAHLQSREPAYLDRLRGQAEAAGLPLVTLVSYSDFTHPDPAERRRQIAELKANIGAAARLGALFVRVTAGQAHPGLAQTDGLGWAVEGLTACLDEAATAGVSLLYENHSIGYTWTHFDFSYPAEIFLEIVRRTEGSGLAILFDTANTLAHGDDPLALLEQVKHRVRMIHTNDVRRAGQFEPVLVGSGVAPIEPIFQLMQAAGFDGWISVEEASGRGEAGFWQAIPYIDSRWQKVGGKARPTGQKGD